MQRGSSSSSASRITFAELLSRDGGEGYDRLVAKYQGVAVTDDAQEYMENYRNIARLIGRTFPNMGIEVLIHDLSNPTHSITTIESGDVTGRVEGMGTTTLLVDLMRRVNLKQDKLNYELNIGARRFKCTTVPIVRKGLRCGRRHLHQHRYQLHSRLRAAFARAYCRVFPELLPHGHDRWKKTSSARTSIKRRLPASATSAIWRRKVRDRRVGQVGFGFSEPTKSIGVPFFTALPSATASQFVSRTQP